MPEGIDLGGERGRWIRPHLLRPAAGQAGAVREFRRRNLRVSRRPVGRVAAAVQPAGPDARTCRGAHRAARAAAVDARPDDRAACLIFDLHTPKRFYNMLRVAKGTSPMSIGTWILMGFSGSSCVTAAAHLVADRVPGLGWLRGVARVGAGAGGGGGRRAEHLHGGAVVRHQHAALGRGAEGAGGAVWCVRGRVRRGGVRAGRAAQPDRPRPGQHRGSRAGGGTGGDAGRRSNATGRPAWTARWSAGGKADRLAGTGFGVVLPLGLFLASLLLTRRRSRTLTTAASLAVLGGSLAMRIGVMAAGDESARRPEISMGFAQPENL